MKNKWIKCSECLPDHNQKVKYRLKDGSISSGSFDALHLIFIPYDKINMYNCHYTFINEWKPIKLKLNKYLWRKMNDEKPKLREKIHIYCNIETAEFFLTGEYHGMCEDRSSFLFLPRNSGNEYSIWDVSKTKWRTMCKLPGEK